MRVILLTSVPTSLRVRPNTNADQQGTWHTMLLHEEPTVSPQASKGPTRSHIHASNSTLPYTSHVDRNRTGKSFGHQRHTLPLYHKTNHTSPSYHHLTARVPRTRFTTRREESQPPAPHRHPLQRIMPCKMTVVRTALLFPLESVSPLLTPRLPQTHHL